MTLVPGYYVHMKPLVAIIGPDDLQTPLATFLEQASVPQLKTVACPDAAAFAACLDYEGAPMSPTSRRSGIIRADWIAKHQSRRPAAALVLIHRDQAVGDPSAWAALSASVDAIAAAAAPRGIRTVVAVASGAGSALPDDRTAMLARHSGADRGFVVTYDPNGGPQSLRSVATAVLAAAAAHYAADASRRLATYSKGGLDSADASLRAAFKLGALAELRGDAAAAAGLYREALGHVPQIPLAGAAPLQRFLEVRAVAELGHSRLQALLLGPLGDAAGAAAQLTAHMAALRAPPLVPCPTGLAANHAGWAARQLAATAEAIAAAGVAPELLPPTARPAHLLAEAAALVASRRRILDGAEDSDLVRKFRAAAEGGHSVAAPGRYLGQLEINGNASPSDEEVEAWLHAEAARETAEGGACLNLLRAAREAAAATAVGPIASQRALCSIDVALGEELLAAGDVEGARAALTEAADQLRADGWPGPLWRALLLLRKCAGKAGDRAAHVALSLEAAALSGVADEGQRRAMAAAAAGELAQLPPMEAAGGSTSFAWTGVFKTSAGWVTPPSSAPQNSTIIPQAPTLTLAVLNAAPVDLPLNSAEITFEDADGEFSLPVTATPEALPAQRPLVLTVALTPAALTHRASHQWISAVKATLCVGPTLTVAIDLLSGGAASIPAASLALQPGPRVEWDQLKAELPPRHDPPLLTLWAPEAALSGEAVGFAVTVDARDRPLRGCKMILAATAAGNAISVIEDGSGTAPQAQMELELPGVAAGATHTTWLRLAPDTRPGDVISITAQLEYAAVVSEAAENIESGTVSAVMVVPVLMPFDCAFAVTGPSDVRYVLPQPSLDAGMQALGVGDRTSNPAAPRLPSSYLLPAGHRCTAAATVRSTVQVPLKILDVQLAVFEVLEATSLGSSVTLAELARAGDACSTGFLIKSSSGTGEMVLPSLGTLTVRWCRAGPAPLTPHPSVEGKSDRTEPPNPPEYYKAAKEHVVEIILPPAALVPPALIVRAAFPPRATAGSAVTLHLDIAAAEPGEVEIEVGEPNGFLVAGPRVTSVEVPAAPRLSLALVPYHVGVLPLPEVTVSKAGVGAVQATHGAVMAVGAAPASEG